MQIEIILKIGGVKMLQVVYVSTATKFMMIEDLQALLEKSRVKNKEKDITGILLYSNRTFIQVLEGDNANVKELYDVIIKDERHENCTLIQEVEIDEKSFGNWSMGFRNLENVDITMLEDFNSFLLSNDTNDVVSISPLIMEALHYFKNSIQ